ncbi:MAG: tRNA adenosine(34) deaminase TadA [Candidatus Cloacimonetes bacterium]|nr:tRNA adenosine(34) deaminase TadA [Candidatus Cloacimonadota bacterium]MBS3768121.1 tRNA adenosine(34) deaminase TadA [Candidatus Cloacimonadota bacterium]
MIDISDEKYSHEYWMKFALAEAKKAVEADEIPIGAVIVKNNELIARDHNRTQQLNLGTAHAEKLVIETAQEKVGKYLYGCKLYITLEPCSMCAGMIILSRLDAVIFGAFDKKSGACGSVYNIPADKRLNHNPEIISGIMAKESSQLLKEFFKTKREN